MRLTTEERYQVVAAYTEKGWYTTQNRLTPEILKKVRQSVEEISRADHPGVVKEEGADVVRALHGCHQYNDVCAQLVRVPLLLDFADALVGEDVYVYQFKVNIKSAKEGKEWPWHQDFSFWAREDGMLRPDAVSLAINLDDVHEHNGPITVLSGSHSIGLVDSADDAEDVARMDWRESFSAKLPYTIPDERVQELARCHPS
jgi:L-proline 4-hydroxylase